LILVAFINAGIDFYQIQKSEVILASFLALICPSCRVVRGGAIDDACCRSGQRRYCVTGSFFSDELGQTQHDDILFPFQRTGDKTPADLISFSATDLKVDNESLTGESEPQERHLLPNGRLKLKIW
jgi:sodium/potassium-transporting ATPase subunit alpha